MARSRTIDEFTKPTSTIIGKGFLIEAAKFSCKEEESMRVDGEIRGDISIEGVLNIGASGYVDGNIHASYVRVSGRVTGNIACRNAVHLANTADVLGDIYASSFIVYDGAILSGRCMTGEFEAQDKLVSN